MTDETLFAAALEQPTPDDRAAFLSSACSDPEQRARVERLLAAHARGGGLRGPASDSDDEGMTQAAREGVSGTRTFPGAPPDPDVAAFLTPPGRPDSLGRIGHYDVLEVLGKGGFGIVFRAFDDKLQRVVAVKVLAPVLAATSPARKRFLREARSAAAIRHENVVQVYGVEEQPLPFLVMEYVPGETLAGRIVRTGPLPADEVVRIARQIASGLVAAHATGLVHRDIKPANVLAEGDPPRVKITDFGLARAADDASLSGSGTVAGTPLFMSPEQARGDSVDARSDLFSLGALVYALLTGHPPFRAGSALAVLKRVTDDTPRSIRELIPETPEWLCGVVDKLLAKDPADRFQTAAEVIAALDRGETGVPPAAPRTAPRRESGQAGGRWPGGRPLLIGLAAAVAAVAVAGGAVAVFAFTRPPAAATTLPVTPPKPVKPAISHPRVASKPFDSRAYLPLAEGHERQVLDFAEIHGVSPQEIVRWTEKLPPGFVPIELGDHPTAEPYQCHAIAVKLSGPPIKWKCWICPAAEDNPESPARKQVRTYRGLVSNFYALPSAGPSTLQVYIEDSAAVTYWMCPNRETETHFVNSRKLSLRPILLLPCVRTQPSLSLHHTLADYGRNRWRAAEGLEADALAGFANDAWRDDLYCGLVRGYRDERGNTRFACVALENPAGVEWELTPALTAAEYEAELVSRKRSGFRPTSVTSYGPANDPKYAVCWVEYAR